MGLGNSSEILMTEISVESGGIWIVFHFNNEIMCIKDAYFYNIRCVDILSRNC